MTFTVKTKDFEERGFKSLKILRNRSLGEFVTVHETEKMKFTKGESPGVFFRDITMPMKEISRNDKKRVLQFQITLVSKKKGRVFLGTAEMSIHDMVHSKVKSFSVYIGKIYKGMIEVVDIEIWNKYAFIDYIYGGMTVSLFVAIDFSLGNKNWSKTDSLHYLSEEKILNPDESDSDNELIQKSGTATKFTKSQIKKLKKKKEMSKAQLNEKSMMDPATKAKMEEEKRQKKFAARDEDNEYQGAIRMTISIL